MLMLGVRGAGVWCAWAWQSHGRSTNVHADEGKRAPACTLPSQTGDPVAPATYPGRQPVALVSIEGMVEEGAERLQCLNLGEEPVATVARAVGMTEKHLSVRLHRARQAWQQPREHTCGTWTEHGCVHCTCG